MDRKCGGLCRCHQGRMRPALPRMIRSAPCLAASRSGMAAMVAALAGQLAPEIANLGHWE